MCARYVDADAFRAWQQVRTAGGAPGAPDRPVVLSTHTGFTDMLAQVRSLAVILYPLFVSHQLTVVSSSVRLVVCCFWVGPGFIEHVMSTNALPRLLFV